MIKGCYNCANASDTHRSAACGSCVIGLENGNAVSDPSEWRAKPESANEQNYQFARVLTLKDISEINRVLGIIEGLTYAVQDSGIADGLVGAVERIEAVVNKGE